MSGCARKLLAGTSRGKEVDMTRALDVFLFFGSGYACLPVMRIEALAWATQTHPARHRHPG